MKLLETIFWKTVSFIFPIIIIISVGLLVHHYRSLGPKKNIKEAIGTVIGYQKGGTSMRPALLVFKVKKKEFYIHISDYYDVGEKFTVEYEEKNPTVNRARLDKPFFLKNEKTNIVVGIVNNYNPNYFRRISFIYFVDGKKYEQSYEPIEDSETKYPDLKVGKKYKVRYWEDYPKRSIILLDEPTNEHLENW